MSDGTLSVELTINRGKEKNIEIFNQLHIFKEEIESEISEELVWDKDSGVMTRIRLYIKDQNWKEIKNKEELFREMNNKMNLLYKSFNERVMKLKTAK